MELENIVANTVYLKAREGNTHCKTEFKPHHLTDQESYPAVRWLLSMALHKLQRAATFDHTVVPGSSE